MKKIPFPGPPIHGLVRDDKGQDVKSLWHGIDPWKWRESTARTRLRFNLITGNSPATIPGSHRKVRAMRNFANKIWNASRFVI